MTHEPWLERAEVHALDALDGEERSQFEAHLAAGCPLCEARLREAREALALLGRSLPPVAPPPEIKARLLARIAEEPARRPRPGAAARDAPRRARLWWGGWAAAAAVILVLGLALSRTREDLRSLQEQMVALRRQAEGQRGLVRLLADPQARIVTLAGLPPSPHAVARLFWNPTSRTGLLLGGGLPPTPADKAYELWAIAGQEPVPAGVFTVGPDGRAVFSIAALPGAKAFDKFAVTLEPAAGVPQPTGPMHLLGSL